MEIKEKESLINNIAKDTKETKNLHMPLPNLNEMDDEYSDPEMDDYEEAEQIFDFQSLIPSFPKGSDVSYKYALVEEKLIPKSASNFDIIQTELTEMHREVAVKYIMQLHYHFKITNDAFYASITYLDICLSKIKIPKKQIQLYAAVCYWTSTKLEARFMEPTVEEINKITGCAFTQEEFDRTEINIVRALNCKLSYPTSKFFMRFYLAIGNANQDAILIAGNVTQLALIKFDFFETKPSVVASASVVLTLESLCNHSAAKKVINVMSRDDIRDIVICMNKLQRYIMQIQRSTRPYEFLDKMKLPINCGSFLES